MAYAIKNNKDLIETYSKEEIDEKILHGDMVGMFSINSSHFGPEVVQEEHIEDGAVTENKIGDYAIKNKHLGPEVVEAGNIAEGAICKVGTYTGAEGKTEITGLGFEPSMVIVLSSYLALQHFIFENGWNITYYDASNKIVNNDGYSSDELRTADGFKIASGVSDILNKAGETYRYIAFR
jgi:hypothetical protein